MRISVDVTLSIRLVICMTLEVLLFNKSLCVLAGQFAVDIGNSFAGGLGPPNPIHSDIARPVRRPVTAPCRNKIKSHSFHYSSVT
jgi:hypothetical protein